MVGGEQPLIPKIFGETDTVRAKTPIFAGNASAVTHSDATRFPEPQKEAQNAKRPFFV